MPLPDVRVNYPRVKTSSLSEECQRLCGLELSPTDYLEWICETRKSFKNLGGKRESNLPVNVKRRTSQRTEGNRTPCKYMKTDETDLYGFACLKRRLCCCWCNRDFSPITRR